VNFIEIIKICKSFIEENKLFFPLFQQLVAYAPILLLLGLRFLVPESTRWLIAKGRNEEARKQILAGCKMNGTAVPKELLYGKGSESSSFIISVVISIESS
jgi:hypothetical protein